MKIVLSIILISIILIMLFVSTGINMKCKQCFYNGYHYHIFPFLTRRQNHGRKIYDQFQHKRCEVCLKNKGKKHYHLNL